MDKRSIRHTALFAAFWLLVLALMLGSATFAWFTFNTSTNVLPMRGTISGGDGELTIASDRNGPFDVQCELVLNAEVDAMLPVSTADLESFYSAAMQNAQGVTLLYQPVREPDACMMHGTVYLRSTGSGCRVYFWPEGLDFGDDIQALASLRLGLRISTAAGTTVRIFALDDMADTSAADSRRTVVDADTVVASVDSGGNAVMAADPAESLSAYFASGSTELVRPGTSALCAIAAGETISVEYWLYLEGCDDNCYNPVQSRDVALQLAFAGA